MAVKARNSANFCARSQHSSWNDCSGGTMNWISGTFGSWSSGSSSLKSGGSAAIWAFLSYVVLLDYGRDNHVLDGIGHRDIARIDRVLGFDDDDGHVVPLADT